MPTHETTHRGNQYIAPLYCNPSVSLGGALLHIGLMLHTSTHNLLSLGINALVQAQPGLVQHLCLSKQLWLFRIYGMPSWVCLSLFCRNNWCMLEFWLLFCMLTGQDLIHNCSSDRAMAAKPSCWESSPEDPGPGHLWDMSGALHTTKTAQVFPHVLWEVPAISGM